MSATSAPCEHCGETFEARTQVLAEAARVDHEATCPQGPVDLDEK